MTITAREWQVMDVLGKMSRDIEWLERTFQEMGQRKLARLTREARYHIWGLREDTAEAFETDDNSIHTAVGREAAQKVIIAPEGVEIHRESGVEILHPSEVRLIMPDGKSLDIREAVEMLKEHLAGGSPHVARHL